MSTTTSSNLLQTAAQAQARQAKYQQRKRLNQLALTLSMAAMLFGVFWLVWILWETIRLGVGGLSLALFTEMTPPPNEAGGLANAIFGSLVLVGHGHVGGHADWCAGWGVPGRIWPPGGVGQYHAVCE